jgi:hypothetical protein
MKSRFCFLIQCHRRAKPYGESQRIGTIGKSGFLPGGFSRKGAKAQRRGAERRKENNMYEWERHEGRTVYRVMACVFGFASLLVFCF